MTSELEHPQKRKFWFIRTSKLGGKIFSHILLALTGLIFGFALSVGLGLELEPSIAISLVTGFGVFAARSLSGYLLFQTVSLAFLSLAVMLAFRIAPNMTIETSFVQLTYLFVFTTVPFLAFLPFLRSPINRLRSSSSIQLVASVSFAFLVFFLRERMPANSGFALSSLYGMEDNAEIAGQLATSLNTGFTTHISGLGQVSNGLYVAAAGLTNQFGLEPSSALIAPFTHWNVTLLFLSWIPFSVLVALVATGRKTSRAFSLAAILSMSAILALLLWPFIGLGHTSVISASLFAVVLLGLTLNKKLADEHPIIFMVLITSLGFIIGNIWFPLMPFAAAAVSLTLVAILQSQFLRGNKRAVIFLLLIFAAAFFALVPRLIELVGANDTLIVLVGATRSASQLLVILWLGLMAMAAWSISRRGAGTKLVGSNLFVLTLAILLASNIYLVITGMLSNGGSSAYGYGATKYLLTSISFSIPILWLVISMKRAKQKSLIAAVTGLSLTFALFVAQPDYGLLFTTRALTVTPPEDPTFETKVTSAIREALESKPDQILCISDKGKPMPVENAQWNDYQWEAYLCTRWSDSLSGNASREGFLWRSTMINSYPEETLGQVRESFAGKKVVIIRFAYPPEENSEPAENDSLWWSKYVDSSWKVIPVS